MEIVSLILSILSFAVSVGIGIYGFILNKKINNINLDAKYIYDLCNEHLVKNIPKAKSHIRFDAELKLSDTTELQDEFVAIWHDFGLFSYLDQEFYMKLKKACQEAEDYLVSISDKRLEGEEQSSFWEELNKKITNIYQLINKKYKNGH